MIKPISGQLLSELNEHDQNVLFLLEVKLNEVIAEVNELKKAHKQAEPDGSVRVP